MKKRIIPVLIAIALIIVVFGASFGAKIIDRYSYSKERADLSSYFEMQGEGDVAIILQDELIEERARLYDGEYYLDLNTVHQYFNDRFYEDQGEGLLLYTLPESIIRTVIGTSEVPALPCSRFPSVPKQSPYPPPSDPSGSRFLHRPEP